MTHSANALLGLVIGLGGHVAGRADDAKPTSPPPAPAAGTTPKGATAAKPPSPPPSAAPVYLALGIRGLGPKGCDIEIAPGYPGCRFRPVSFHLSQEDSREVRQIAFEDVQTTGPDRYCIFAVTIREPGQPVQTVRRGARIAGPSAERTGPQVVNCYLSSPSRLAKGSEMRERR